MPEKQKKICMLVRNNFLHDSRVLNEALTVKSHGYLVNIIAVQTKNVLPNDKVQDIDVVRVKIGIDKYFVRAKIKNFIEKNTYFHQKLIKRINNFQSKNRTIAKFIYFKLIKKIIRRNQKITNKFLRLISRFQQPIMKFIAIHLKGTSTTFRMLNKAIAIDADIYHAHDLNTLLAAYIAAKKLKRLVVYDSHELFIERNTLNYSKYQKLKDYFFEKFAIRRVNGIITVNDYIAAILSKRYKVMIDKVVMNCPLINNMEKKVDHPIVDLNHKQKLIIYIGAITFGRGIEQLIDALKYLNENITVILLGQGNQEYINKIGNLAKESSNKNRFIIYPPVKHELVVSVAKYADVGIVPTQPSCLSYYYSSPNKLFQYVMAGLPIIGSDIPFHRDIILNNRIGEVFIPDSPKDIAYKINKILYNATELQSMKDRVGALQQKYCWENESKKLVELYESLSG